MGKKRFLSQFRQFIDVWFDDEELKSNHLIHITEDKHLLKDFMDFYNPWYVDQAGGNVGAIEVVLKDKSIRMLSVREAEKHPERWDKHEEVKPSLTRPVIIATDTGISKTLIIDSNKTICRLLFKYSASVEQKISTLEISGPDLQRLNRYGDFKALRQRLGPNNT